MDRFRYPDIVGTHGTDTTISTATTLTPPVGATKLILQAQGQDVRYTLDGTTPTASVGFILYAGDTATIPVGQSAVVKVIEATSGGAVAYQWAV